ncbi:hypothetical protein GF345_00310 [Candidatus Woesearchaeota archaeon]|nr:hypothetical protein [Candidatus Woesearchaeota archaeon]
MRKIAIFTVVLAILFLTAACSQSEEPVPEVSSPAPDTEVDVSPEPDVEEDEPELPADTYEILPSDLGNPITLRYRIDPDDEGIVKSMTFDMRNFGDDPVKPVVIAYVGGASDANIKRFEYDELPAGYKMIKTEDINLKVSSLHEPNAIKATLRDGLENDALLGEDSKNYIARPSYD